MQRPKALWAYLPWAGTGYSAPWILSLPSCRAAQQTLTLTNTSALPFKIFPKWLKNTDKVMLMMMFLGLGVTRGGHPGKSVITNTPDCLDHSHTCRSALLMQRPNAISQLTLHTGHTNDRYMQHGQDAIKTVACKVQSF